MPYVEVVESQDAKKVKSTCVASERRNCTKTGAVLKLRNEQRVTAKVISPIELVSSGECFDEDEPEVRKVWLALSQNHGSRDLVAVEGCARQIHLRFRLH